MKFLLLVILFAGAGIFLISRILEPESVTVVQTKKEVEKIDAPEAFTHQEQPQQPVNLDEILSPDQVAAICRKNPTEALTALRQRQIKVRARVHAIQVTGMRSQDLIFVVLASDNFRLNFYTDSAKRYGKFWELPGNAFYYSVQGNELLVRQRTASAHKTQADNVLMKTGRLAEITGEVESISRASLRLLLLDMRPL